MRAAVAIPGSGPPVNENPPGHRREFSAGASWFFGMMLLMLVAGSTLAMQAPTTTAVADAQINSLFNSIPPREALVAERRISPLHKA